MLAVLEILEEGDTVLRTGWVVEDALELNAKFVPLRNSRGPIASARVVLYSVEG
jgi:hypothetical protein